MLSILRPRLSSNRVPRIKHASRNYATAAVSASSEAQAVQYPPIEDLSYRARKRAKEEKWYGEIKALQTVEEKLFKINMPYYYGWKSLILNEHRVMYNSLAHAQYITRTHVAREPGLPSYYNGVASAEELDRIAKDLVDQIKEGISFELASRKKWQELDKESLTEVDIDNITARDVTRQINRTLLCNLSSRYPHLLEAQLDFDPRIEAFWLVGGINPSDHLRKAREGLRHMKEYANDPVNVPVQYTGEPILNLRHSSPLPPIISASEAENPELDVPTFKMSPKVLGYQYQRRHGTNIPGFWPGDECEFGLLSLHNRGYLRNRPASYNDELDALATQAVLASYGWLLSQACYQGFSTFQDVTYPLVSQMAITNGQWWSLSAYQLNTTLVYSEHSDENPKRNVCWVTEPMKLYESVEDGVVRGFDEDVLKQLLKFYLNAPRERVGVEMKPYLGESVKWIADIEEDERRAWLEKHYKHLVSNRKRHRRLPEIYAWQWIYQIYNKTCPTWKKREPFEFGINPYKRRLDEHQPEYIPRKLRDPRPSQRGKGRWAKTYYP